MNRAKVITIGVGKGAWPRFFKLSFDWTSVTKQDGLWDQYQQVEGECHAPLTGRFQGLFPRIPWANE